MNYKLKHLSKYCCKPANELEFEAVKMAAEIGGVDFIIEKHMSGFYYFYNPNYEVFDYGVADAFYVAKLNKISVLDFCNKLRMSEEEAENLEDDRVDIAEHSSAGCDCMRDGVKYIKADSGYYFNTNEDGTEVTLHKRD